MRARDISESLELMKDKPIFQILKFHLQMKKKKKKKKTALKLTKNEKL